MDPYIYVFNTSGCHGHYLTYLIDRLSNNTATITELPFNNLGTSHKKLNYSGYVKFVDTLQHKDNAHLKNTHVIKITGDDVLYYERVAMNRAEDAQRDLHTLHKDISFLKTYSKNFYDNIVKTYKVKNNTVPKWVLRDAWKLGFLDLENQGAVKDLKADVDENRFEQELIYYLEKYDITEEKVRLENHLDYFLKTIDSNGQNGKKLGFISQEIGREINTIGSKSNYAPMQKLVVQMKDELEKIKEQILNVL